MDDGLLDHSLLDDVQRYELPWLTDPASQPGYHEHATRWMSVTREASSDVQRAEPWVGSARAPDLGEAASPHGISGISWSDAVFLDDLTPNDRPGQDVPAPDQQADEHTIHDELPAFALGAIGDDDAVHFEAHVTTCEACQSALQPLRHVVDLLPYGLSPEQPTPGARDRLLATARHDAGRTTAPEPDAASATPVPEDAAPGSAAPHPATSQSATPESVLPAAETPATETPATETTQRPVVEPPAEAPSSAALETQTADESATAASEVVQPALEVAPEEVTASDPIPELTGELLPPVSAQAELVHATAVDPSVSRTVVAVYVTPNPQAESAEHRERSRMALARRAETMTAAEMIAVGLAPLPDAAGSSGDRGTRGGTRVNVKALVWGTILVFVLFSGLMVMLWSAAGPRVSLGVALFSRMPGGQVLSLRGTGVPTASSTLYVVGSSRRAELAINDLPPLAEGRIYQLWFVDSSQTIRTGGSFYVNQQGDTVARLTVPVPVNEIRSIAVTEEPAPASRVPTGDHLIAWTR